MALKTILLHLDDAPRCVERTRVAAQLAVQHEAHLIGLYAIDTWALPATQALVGEHPLVVKEQQRLRDNREIAAHKFQEAVRWAGASAEWRAAEGDPVTAMRVNARYADLVVLGQTDPDQSAPLVPNDFPELVCFASGRPVLVVPYTGNFKQLGERVLVAWNASREATRAVTDGLPILEAASRVDVLTINPSRHRDAHGEIPGADIAWFLARHGVKAQTVNSFVDSDVGAEILTRAADLDSDLIVMGAYGHSRLRELALSGATRTMLQSMTVPVLMSH